jgi:hypothetical protein
MNAVDDDRPVTAAGIARPPRTTFAFRLPASVIDAVGEFVILLIGVAGGFHG